MLEGGKEVIDLLQALMMLRILFLVSSDHEVDRGLSIDQLRILLTACSPNVNIQGHISLGHEIGVSNFIRVIGTHLQVLKFEYSLDTMPSELLSALGNIEELALFPVEGYSDEMIQSVFFEPLPHLQKLTIFKVKTSKMLRIVARSVTNLLELYCSFRPEFEEYQGAEGVVEMEVDVRRVPVTSIDFIELLRTNTHVRYVVVGFRKTEKPVTNEITEFIPLLKDCDSLKHMDVTNGISDNLSEEMPNSERLREISNACVPLRNKSFSLSVNDVYYLQS